MAAKVSTPRHQTYGSNSRVGPSLLNKLAPTKFIRCVVEMLDDSITEVDIESRSSGGVLFKKIINELNLAEPDYFGLQVFRNFSSKPTGWLEHDKIIKRQLRGQVQPFKFRFGVRFFPTEPSRVAEDLTRYHMFLSIKQDLRNGRLSCPKDTAAELSSLIVQSETGDYQPNYLPDQYISDYQLIPNQTAEFEDRVFHYHRENVGLSPAQAELKFLEIAKRLELYGSEVQRAKDSEGYDIEIIVCSEGIKIFRENKRLNVFAWSRIEKVLFQRKNFEVQLLPDIDKDPESKTVVGFILPSVTRCKALWKSTVAHHTFYRKDYRDRLRERPKLIRFGSTYKYRGRTEFQAVEAARRSFRKETAFQRTSSSRHSEKSIGKLTGSSISGSGKFRCETDSEVTSMSTTQGSYDVLNPSDSDSRSPASLSPVRTEMNGILNDEGLLDISVQPNKNGQFGLNFKGGAEQKLKPIITQIAPDSPASMCDPQLQEGDEIVYINGRKAEQLTHEQICCLIRSIGQSATNKTLTLSLRPFGSIENHEIKNSGTNGSSNHGISSQLLTSMAQIKQGLENGDLLEFYVDMPKKKLELSTETAHLPENKTKNRYRDILPYDFNRVVISGENDYINASHIQMDIGYSGMTNEYLAAQGPLSDTCGDFWQMIWDQEVTLVVMLTTTMENGKTKCHRYWPECGEHFEVGNFEVSPVSSRDYSPAYIHRELTVTELETDEERTIQHLQYIAWPDHGVPEDSRGFLTFVNEVRRHRSASGAPIVIHCSAGVGRTGVFMAVETACCLIEAGVGVYPQQMLDTLRDQRPSLIQTPGQFKFTCETFLDIYQDHFLKTQAMNGR